MGIKNVFSLLIISVLLLVSVFLSGCLEPGPSAYQANSGKPWEMKAVSFLPPSAFQTKTLLTIIRIVNEKSQGELKINYLGGPEVMPPANFATGLRKSIINIAQLPLEVYDDLVPVGSTMELSELTPAEERASGAYTYINEVHNKVGLYFLERGVGYTSANAFTLHTNKQTPTPYNLRGQRIASSAAIMDACLKSWGAVPVHILNSEFYTAMERGIVDGFLQPIVQTTDYQLFRVTQYAIDPPFLRGAFAITLSLDSWNRLPQHLKDLFTQAAIEAIKESAADVDAQLAEGRKVAERSGMEFITWSRADNDLFLKRIYETGWSERMAKYPEVTSKLEPLISKVR
jgi:TRAP-type transport system periplasmic protein